MEITFEQRETPYVCSSILWQLEVSAGRQSDLKDMEATALRRERFEAILSDPVKRSGLLHRVTKPQAGWMEAKSSVQQRPLPLSAQAAVEEECKEWEAIWTTASPEEPLWHHAAAATEDEKLEDITAAAVREACRAFKPSTGLGVEGWHPRHWSWLSDAAVWGLIRCLRAADRLQK